MNPEDSRYDRSHVPEFCWSDGVPVSNWSKAIAALGLTANRAQAGEASTISADDYTELPIAA